MITYSRLGKCGRLGNQLWQLASTAGIAQQMGQPVGFFHWDYRPFFCVPDEFFPETIVDRPWGFTQAHQTPLVDHIDPRAREYLQDYRLWEPIKDQVWDWLQPSDLAMERLSEELEWIQDLDPPRLSIHVRRGDNANAPNNCHPLRPWSFYQQAIERMRGEFGSIIVFSDDPDWCRTAFAGYEIEYPLAFYVGTPRAKEHEKAYVIDPALDWIDLQLMSFCDRHILGNSTFAWWGAFLSHDPAPIYPTPWFGTELQYIDASLMFPKGWIPIDHGQQYV